MTGRGPLTTALVITHGLALSADDATPVTVPHLVTALRDGGCSAVTVLDDVPGARAALDRVAAAAAGGAVLLVRGDVVLTGSAVLTLVTEPRGSAATLVTSSGPGWRVRVERGSVASAGSPLHSVTAATGVAPGALLVRDPAALAGAVEALRRLPELPDALPPPDLVAVLTVALVRGGAPVAAVAADGYRVRLAGSASDAAGALADAAAVDERAVRLAAAVKAEDSPYATYLVSSWSRYLARWAAERGIAPNAVTVGSLLLGIAAAAAFAAGSRWWLVTGALLLQASFVLDCVDGEVARYARRFSPLGGWLDASSDRVKEYAVYAGLAVGAIRTGDDVWVLAGAALGLQVFRHAVDFGFAARQEERAPVTVVPLGQQGDALAARAEPGQGRPAGAAGLGEGAVRLSARTSASRALRSAKRMVILPIAERWALISLCAAVAGARVAFLALLAWGGLAAAYTLSGRVLRSVADA
ncbi:MAG: CDP-alcohol phosphatidyltransferase family protein [Frankiaceae bacterium]